jgi:hypothetical protein
MRADRKKREVRGSRTTMTMGRSAQRIATRMIAIAMRMTGTVMRTMMWVPAWTWLQTRRFRSA